MIIEVKASILAFRLEDISRIADGPGRMPVELCARQNDTKNGVVTVRTYVNGVDVELCVVGAKVIEPGTIYPERGFVEAVTAFGRHLLLIKSTDDALSPFSIECGHLLVKFMQQGCSVQPKQKTLPTVPCAVFDTCELFDALCAICHAQCYEYDRPVLRGVKIEFEECNKLVAVATDGRRLVCYSRQVSRVSLPSPTFSVYLPRPATEFLARCTHGDTTSIFVDENRVSIRSGSDFGIFAIRSQGPFPKWRDCVPKDPQPIATFECTELATALDAAIGAFNPTGSWPVEATLAKSDCGKVKVNMIVREASCIDRMEFSAEVAATVAKPIELCVNAKHLRDAIGDNGGKLEVLGGFVDDPPRISVLVLRFAGNPNVFEVLMPIHH